MFEITPATTSKHIDDARVLFREYEAWLGLSLCFQGFEEELEALPGKYAAPYGRLLLVYSGEDALGCAALRDLGDNVCEMKRLFVRGKARGTGLGYRLIERLIAEGREIGYRAMRLDTYPAKMGKAVSLYEAYGFREISAYYDNPHESVLFMELSL